jgi:hypothetical protein
MGYYQDCAIPKGPHSQPEKVAKRAKRVNSERSAKEQVRARDGRRCRVPGCRDQAKGWRLEVAHLSDKGMGGDHGTRSKRHLMICLCYPHHQGQDGYSLHNERLRIEPETSEGADGPCKFSVHKESGWDVVGVA